MAVTVAPDTRVRLSLDELDGIALAGGPSGAAVESASTGDAVQWDTSEPLKPSACPDQLTVTWEMAGVEVSATVDVVSTRYCTLDEVRGYRPESYGNVLSKLTDEQLFQARARAEEVIEREAHRHFQPVVRMAVTDRPNCSPCSLAMSGEGAVFDIRRVLRATDQDGKAVNVTRATDTQLDVRQLGFGKMAEVALVCGMAATPAEMRDAVAALASWYLIPSANPENATSTSTEAGVMNFVIGGVSGAATSLPEVNALIERYGMREYRVR